MYVTGWHAHLVPSIEARLDGVPSQQDKELSQKEVSVLLSSGAYAKSVGLWGGSHYRKADGAGCYHLRLYKRRAFLHRDAWDPRRHPFRHVMETPELVVGTVGLALVAAGVVAVAVSGEKKGE